MSVLRFLKHHLGAFALVCLLLALQAVSELALPQMMSDIVDVGIGQRGIPSSVFSHVRAQTLSDLESHLDAGEVALVEATPPRNAPPRSFPRCFHVRSRSRRVPTMTPSRPSAPSRT